MNNSTTFRLALLAALVILGSLATRAQVFNVYNVDASAFPKITADYVALDGAGAPITNLTAADFLVRETPNGLATRDLSATVKHNCKDITTDPQASILIIMDRSFSMIDKIDGGNKRRWDYARDAVKAFVSNVNFTGETRVSVVSFASNYETWVPWTNNPNEIRDTLDKREPGGVTNYRAPFRADEPQNVFNLFKQRPANLPRFIFFLTDGHPNPGFSADADGIRWADSVSKTCQQNNIRFYSVTILEQTTHYTLADIARATGGKSIVTNESKLVNLFSYLALETQIRRVCSLEWTSSAACGEASRDRIVDITLKRGNPFPAMKVNFTAPSTAVARIDVSNPVLYCGDPPAGGTAVADVTLTAVGAPFTFTSFAITPPTYFSIIDYNYPQNQQTAPASITIPAGQKRTFRIQFKQGTIRQFRAAQLLLDGTPCAQIVSLVGGTGQILLTSPVGGELYSTCDTVTIKWAGVLPTDNVTIQFSEDDGANWTTITTSAKGLSYKWLPPRQGQRYRIKVIYDPQPDYAWATQLGGASAETSNSISVSQDELRIYVAGWYDGPSKFGDQVVNNTDGNVDGFMSELDGDGKVVKTTLLTGNGNNDEKVIGALVDKDGFVYVAGQFESQAATFGSIGLNLQGTNDTKNVFIMKLAPTGNQMNSAQIGGSATQRSTVEITDFGLEYNAAGLPRLTVVGRYQRYARAGADKNGNFVQIGPVISPNWINFYAVYDENLVPLSIANGPRPGGPAYTTKTVTRGTWRYETDTYTAPKTFGSARPLPNSGKTDVFVAKFGAPQTSNKASDSAFRVLAPAFSFTPNTVTVDPIVQGSTSAKTFPGIIRNTGAFDIVLCEPTFTGPNAADFSVVGKLKGVTLRRGESLGIEIAFTPQGTGTRTAKMSLCGTCNTLAELNVTGEGLAPCAWTLASPVDMGTVVLGQSGTLTNVQILRNDGPNPLQGNLQYVSGSTDISITRGIGAFSIPPGQYMTVDITYTPTSQGNAQRFVNFNLPPECGAAIGIINGKSVDPVITIDSVDFGNRRLLTTTLDTIKVTNRTPLPARVTGLALSDATNAHLKFTLPGTPFTLAPDESKDIVVAYTPQDRSQQSVDVTATIEGSAKPIIGNARGGGILPAIDATGFTFQPWTVGQQSPEKGTVTIRNTDAATPLTIYSIAFVGAASDFAWSVPPPTMPVVLQPGSAPLTLEVLFTPQAQGDRAVQVCIEHDAKPGPDPIPPYAKTCVDIKGIGTVPSALDPIVFGDVLTCATKTDAKTIVIKNQHPTQTLTISQIGQSGQVNAFNVLLAAPVTIQPASQITVPVQFAPPVPGSFSAAYELKNDQGLDLMINVSGTGITAPVKATFGTIGRGEIGKKVAMPIGIDISAIDTVSVRSLELTVTYPSTVLSFAELDAAGQQAGWTFTPNVATAGQLTIAATGAAGVTSGTLVTPTFNVFLNADSTLPVSVALATKAYSCLVPTGDQSKVTMQLTCYAEGRLIKIGARTFGLKEPMPNPVTDVTTVQYSTGLEVETVFDVIDGVGNIVKQIVTPVLPSADYELSLDVANLGSGTYYLRMTSGPFVSTQPLMVVR